MKAVAWQNMKWYFFGWCNVLTLNDIRQLSYVNPTLCGKVTRGKFIALHLTALLVLPSRNVSSLYGSLEHRLFYGLFWACTCMLRGDLNAAEQRPISALVLSRNI